VDIRDVVQLPIGCWRCNVEADVRPVGKEDRNSAPSVVGLYDNPPPGQTQKPEIQTSMNVATTSSLRTKTLFN
jgi:hypothetical protein